MKQYLYDVNMCTLSSVCCNVLQILLLGLMHTKWLGIEVLFSTLLLDVFNHFKNSRSRKAGTVFTNIVPLCGSYCLPVSAIRGGGGYF